MSGAPCCCCMPDSKEQKIGAQADIEFLDISSEVIEYKIGAQADIEFIET